MSTSGMEPEDEGLTLRGTIEETSIPELLRSVMTSGETGVLHVRNGQVKKSFFLHTGRVVYATSSNPDERMGEDLLLRGKITIRQYLEASKLIRPGKRLGAILVELEALDSEELLSAVETHVKEILLDVFTWSGGEYELVMTEPADDVVTLNFPMESLILEGIRRTRAWSRIYRGVGGDVGAIPVPTGNTEVLLKLELTPEEQEVLSHVNGRSTIEQICQVSFLSNLETCRILWAFHVLGVVKREMPGETARQAEEGLRVRHQELDLEDVAEKVNQILGRIYTFLRGRSGDDVDEFMAKALSRASARFETLFDGVDLQQYGRADYDQMLANVAHLPADERRSLILAGLNELVTAVQLGVRERHGAQEEAVVSGIIKEGYRKLGVA